MSYRALSLGAGAGAGSGAGAGATAAASSSEEAKLAVEIGKVLDTSLTPLVEQAKNLEKATQEVIALKAEISSLRRRVYIVRWIDVDKLVVRAGADLVGSVQTLLKNEGFAGPVAMLMHQRTKEDEAVYTEYVRLCNTVQRTGSGIDIVHVDAKTKDSDLARYPVVLVPAKPSEPDSALTQTLGERLWILDEKLRDHIVRLLRGKRSGTLSWRA